MLPKQLMDNGRLAMIGLFALIMASLSGSYQVSISALANQLLLEGNATYYNFR